MSEEKGEIHSNIGKRVTFETITQSHKFDPKSAPHKGKHEKISGTTSIRRLNPQIMREASIKAAKKAKLAQEIAHRNLQLAFHKAAIDACDELDDIEYEARIKKEEAQDKNSFLPLKEWIADRIVSQEKDEKRRIRKYLERKRIETLYGNIDEDDIGDGEEEEEDEVTIEDPFPIYSESTLKIQKFKRKITGERLKFDFQKASTYLGFILGNELTSGYLPCIVALKHSSFDQFTRQTTLLCIHLMNYINRLRLVFLREYFLSQINFQKQKTHEECPKCVRVQFKNREEAKQYWVFAERHIPYFPSLEPPFRCPLCFSSLPSIHMFLLHVDVHVQASVNKYLHCDEGQRHMQNIIYENAQNEDDIQIDSCSPSKEYSSEEEKTDEDSELEDITYQFKSACKKRFSTSKRSPILTDNQSPDCDKSPKVPPINRSVISDVFLSTLSPITTLLLISLLQIRHSPHCERGCLDCAVCEAETRIPSLLIHGLCRNRGREEEENDICDKSLFIETELKDIEGKRIKEDGDGIEEELEEEKKKGRQESGKGEKEEEGKIKKEHEKVENEKVENEKLEEQNSPQQERLILSFSSSIPVKKSILQEIRPKEEENDICRDDSEASNPIQDQPIPSDVTIYDVESVQQRTEHLKYHLCCPISQCKICTMSEEDMVLHIRAKHSFLYIFDKEIL
ncbi:hypothetical protein ADUPG1_013070 [Aduncisulcus paluster]|uniref:C2H2-type domain-containing protein n=1 Tax=Aduncisulcus paluster TaxID=2918883 RepID=A0ABQ5K1N4_9EUKA|nr:hypothetical protein ADUPG1_013070 [Aduncisulcus paluster]